jgi:hypothetical protein
MIPKKLEELVDKYPNNYELGEEVRKYYHKNKQKENFNSGVLWIGVLFFFIFASLLTWIVTV